MMPTDTPQGTRSRAAPRYRPKDRPSARSWASSTAVSSADLAIQCPLKGASTRPTATASRSPAAASAGTKKRVMTSCAPSTYSAE